MSLKYKTAKNLNKNTNIIHGFFTRVGGISEGIYASLNCGYGSNDKHENVKENRKRVANSLHSDPTLLFTPYQIHSNEVVIAEKAWQPTEAPKADAIVTKRKDLRIAVLTADCGPIIFADSKASIIGVAHSGWKGALGGIIENTIKKMQDLGAAKENIQAAIGPSISQNAYEIGPEFKNNFINSRPEYANFFKQFPSGKDHFNLPGFIEHRLQKVGIQSIENLNICTTSNESEFFSYRRTTHQKEQDYGRQISVIGLK